MTESSSQITDLPINKNFQQGQAVQPVSQQFQMNAQREVQSHLNQGVQRPNPNNDNITIQVHETQNQYQQPHPQQHPSGFQQPPQQQGPPQQSFEYKPFTNTNAQTANMQTIQQYSQPQPSGQGPGQGQGQALSTVEFQAMMNAIQTPGQQNTQLASRDVPQSNFQQSADIQSHPNYVPGQMKTDPVRQTTQDDLQQQNMASASAETDFIEKHNESLQRKELQETKSRKMESVFEMMMEQIHVPVILAILYFMFQLPFFNERLRTQLPFLFVRENKMSVYGIVLKAILFALSYAGINQLLEYMKV